MSQPLLAVAPVSAAEAGAAAPAAARATAPQEDFGRWLGEAVGGVNQDVAGAERAVQMMAVGQAGSLPEVMIAIENARHSLSLMIQVRDRLVGAYQNILQMQI